MREFLAAEVNTLDIVICFLFAFVEWMLFLVFVYVCVCVRERFKRLN